ncbi:MAG: hypothetical protein Kow0025_24840 [Thermodesulfovibrionales bacterium]
MRKLALLIALALALSCSQDRRAGGPAPAGEAAAPVKEEARAVEAPGSGGGGVGLYIEPAQPDRRTTLTLRASGFDIGSAAVEWVVNGMPSARGGPEGFPASELSKGDQVAARAFAGGRTVESNAVVIGNAPPELTEVRLVPEVFRPGDRLGVEAAWDDPDGDSVTLSYQWTVNGEPAGSGPAIGSEIARGDLLAVTVTPFDGEAAGAPVTLRREVGNQPPMISEALNYSFDGSVYTFKVEAADPDGDALTFSLVSGPEGMTIDPSSGLVRWDVPPGFAGKVSFHVAAADGRGGESARSLDLTIGPESPQNR